MTTSFHAMGLAQSSALNLSPIMLGCNRLGAQIDPVTSERLLGEAADCGVTTFDTAPHYGGGASEEIVGGFLRTSRADFIVSTKFGYDSRGVEGSLPATDSGSPRYIRTSLEASLRRLGTDYIDLYNYHVMDQVTPIEETLGALNDLIAEGKIRELGACSIPAWRYIDAQWTAHLLGMNGFSYIHHEYNLINRSVEKDIVPALERGKSRMIAFFPLAAGLLTGKYHSMVDVPAGSRFEQDARHRGQFLTDRNLCVVKRLHECVVDWGRPLHDIALNWLASRPTVAGMVCGVSAPNQIRQSVQALATPLCDDEIAVLAKVWESA
ncbi:aldo/keto reductase [Ensifer sp. YR511]|uniref:aldo/keto reductase n=1 Tax=Ensifer sp. YR511 TaxID=1855294 RepID=UPI0008904A7A|nr:aldo/keto reductase [Ensifer sp. YR511]SDN42739.1 Predicted oxidoreductase [Ensifer sp. YR511]